MLHKDLKIEIIKKFDSQANFAQELGVHESKISWILRGRRKLSKEEVKKWMGLLGCGKQMFKEVTKGV